jgi:hypothetical protein
VRHTDIVRAGIEEERVAPVQTLMGQPALFRRQAELLRRVFIGGRPAALNEVRIDVTADLPVALAQVSRRHRSLLLFMSITWMQSAGRLFGGRCFYQDAISVFETFFVDDEVGSSPNKIASLPHFRYNLQRSNRAVTRQPALTRAFTSKWRCYIRGPDHQC